MDFEPDIGLEVHVELQTRSKMYCSCGVVDSTSAAANSAVCPICSGMPGTLPVVNQRAVEYGVRVALALESEVQPTSIFARKNYFYPDLPKGYQITQYDHPLALNGRLLIRVPAGEQNIRIRRIHLEEDTGKLTHVERDGRSYTLVDLNRAGVPLLEIVSEPDLHSAESARSYGEALRAILHTLGVNSGDLEKGVIRFEANISVRPKGSQERGTRTEVKNLNSFRAMERAIDYEIERQSKIIGSGGSVLQETLGWSEVRGETYSQRSKEDAHDYRYLPEPDLPPLVIDKDWISRVQSELPELPNSKFTRLVKQYGLNAYSAQRLLEYEGMADYFEQAAKSGPPQEVANWILGDLFALMNQTHLDLKQLKIAPAALGELAKITGADQINQPTAKDVLAEMFTTGRGPADIVATRGLGQVSDKSLIAEWVLQVLAENPKEVAMFRAGKAGIANFLFGLVMKKAAGKADPRLVRAELEKQLAK
jgi:aspartyl-tRNA(Asn)/glutamyl-tRNA(Gln) amidotransferase subunit B